MTVRSTSATLALILGACGSSGQPPAAPGPIEPSGVYTAAPAASDAPEPTHEADAPEISRSKGQSGGTLVLWPRIVLPRGAGDPNAETIAAARRVQSRLAELARRASEGRAVEVRPEPERVCPKTGCDAIAVGALLAVAGKGCAVVAHVSAPGVTPARLVPLVGQIRLEAQTVPFREPPETVLGVTDYVPCERVVDDLAPDRAAALESAIVQANR